MRLKLANKTVNFSFFSVKIQIALIMIYRIIFIYSLSICRDDGDHHLNTNHSGSLR